GSYTPGGGSDPCGSGVPCTNSQIVQRDQWLFQQQLAAFLPNASAIIDCDGSLLSDTPEQQAASPFDGLCTISISWSEASLDRSATGAPDDQTFAWVFQP